MASIKNTCDVVLQSATSTKRNVFFVGPYGARVSFASQQRRALNLVWALYKEDIIPVGKEIDVAVVGAGIAGVMAAAALIAKGCNVFLFETRGRVLALQRGATHRLVHPTINFWPNEELAWTTEFPFFDWFAGSSAGVVESIAREWDHCFAKRISEPHFNKRVSGFEYDPATEKVKVQVASKDFLDVDVAIVTTGFGVEDHMSDPVQTTYWRQDEIDDYARATNVKVAVSGTGDGGIIETLRLTYPGFMEDERALKFLLLEDRESLRDKVREIEARAVAEDNPRKRSEIYAAAYAEVARRRSELAKDLLPPLPAEKIPVLLVGRLPAPFEESAAPVHKLILAHSLTEKRIVYEQGTLRRARGKYRVVRPDGSILDLADYARVFVRHGATPPIVDFVGKIESKKLRSLQRLVGDFIKIPDLTWDFFDNDKVYPRRGPGSRKFVERRLAMAEKFLRDRFRLAVHIDAANPAAIRFAARPVGVPLGAPINLDSLPETLFGIGLEPPPGHYPDADSLVGIGSC